MIKKVLGKIWQQLTTPLPLEIYPKIISLVLLIMAIPIGLILVKNPARFTSLAEIKTSKTTIINLNPSFTDGISSWQVFPPEKLIFISEGGTAKITLLKSTNEILLLQDNIYPKNELPYQVKITAKSTKPISLLVSLVSENSVVNYGLQNASVPLTNSWSTHTIDFVSQNIPPKTSSGAHLLITAENVPAKTEISFSLISLTQLH